MGKILLRRVLWVLTVVNALCVLVLAWYTYAYVGVPMAVCNVAFATWLGLVAFVTKSCWSPRLTVPGR